MTPQRKAFIKWWDKTHEWPFDEETGGLYAKHALKAFEAGYLSHCTETGGEVKCVSCGHPRNNHPFRHAFVAPIPW